MYQQFITKIHAATGQFALAVTGGGTRAIAELFAVSGASRSVLEAVVPYSERALTDYLGSQGENSCTTRTARAMAMVAWQRAKRFSGLSSSFGIGCTAAIKTDRTRQGQDRCHLALQNDQSTVEVTLLLEKNLSRQQQEQICTHAVLQLIGRGCGIEPSDMPDLPGFSQADISERYVDADASWRALLTGEIKKSKATDHTAIFPGAFSPMHSGHINMLKIARERYGFKNALEISITNVDKPPLDFLDMYDRQTALTDFDIIFTDAPTFAEKASVFPGVSFIVGLDTIVRIADTKYYAGDAGKRDSAIKHIAAAGNKFLVFGRVGNSRFETLEDVALPHALTELCTGVSEKDFREDISSTLLRKALNDGAKIE